MVKTRLLLILVFMILPPAAVFFAGRWHVNADAAQNGGGDRAADCGGSRVSVAEVGPVRSMAAEMLVMADGMGQTMTARWVPGSRPTKSAAGPADGWWPLNAADHSARLSLPRQFGVACDSFDSLAPRLKSSYYGLNQRAWSRLDAGAAGYANNGLPTNVLDRMELFYYDASWRLLERRTDETWNGTSFTHDSTSQWVWGHRYIDELVASITDGDVNDEFEDRFYAMTDRNFSVIGLSQSAGSSGKRVRYDAYGHAQAMPLGDSNHDGATDLDDHSIVLVNFGAEIGDTGSPLYRVEADFNSDGAIDLDDLGTVLSNFGTSIDRGRLSDSGNIVGYAGYIFEHATGMYVVRHRWYSTENGRWLSRDPLGYVDGSSVYEYVASRSSSNTDPFGLGIRIKYPNGQPIKHGESPQDHGNNYNKFIALVLKVMKEMCPDSLDFSVVGNDIKITWIGKDCPESIACKCFKKLIENDQDNWIVPSSDGKIPSGAVPRTRDGELHYPDGMGPPSPGEPAPGIFFWNPILVPMERDSKDSEWREMHPDIIFYHELCGHIIDINDGVQVPMFDGHDPANPPHEIVPIRRENEYRFRRFYPQRPDVYHDDDLYKVEPDPKRL